MKEAPAELIGHNIVTCAVYGKNQVEWTKLFKKTFRFTGDEIVNEFLMSIGYLSGAYIETCPVYKEIMKQNPK